MHEQSETVTRPSGSVNVYGGTQFPLPKAFGFEKNYYPSQTEAVNAAQWRSRMGGGPEEYPDAPSYGFKNQPNTNPYAPIVGGAVDALQDPRVGMFPGAGLAGMGFRAVGKAGQTGTKVMRNKMAQHVNDEMPWIEPRARGAMDDTLRSAGLVEREPLPYQQAVTMRQPQGDQSLARAAEEMRQSMGWTGEQLQQWMSKYRK